MILRFPEPPGLSEFLQRYWQREALHMPAALPGVDDLLDPDDLLALACRDDIESRLIRCDTSQRDWQLEQGPFDASVLAALPDSNWSLLVQDVDRFVPEIGALLSAFDFLPSWRREDIMVSYAAPGGTVGPHIDQYDAFLIQGTGTRCWETGHSDTQLMPDQPLGVLQQFETRHRFEMATGDVLYMPPGVAHYGVSVTPCITLSVGFRAPSAGELLLAQAETLAGLNVSRYSDRDLQPDEVEDGLISVTAIARVRELLRRATHDDPAQIAAWFGQLVTEGKPWLTAEPPDHELAREEFMARHTAAPLLPHPWLRCARSDGEGYRFLFVDGERYVIPDAGEALARRICRGAAVCFDPDTQCFDLVYRLYCAGKLYWPDES